MSDRNCDLCSASVGDGKKDKSYVVLVLPAKNGQTTLCKGCLMRSIHAESGAMIMKDREIMPPLLAFPRLTSQGDRVPEEYLEIAMSLGWRIGTMNDAMVVDAHFRQSLMFNFFSPGEGWRKDVRKTSLECFKRSCRNIRDCYASWIAFSEKQK